MKKVLCMLFAMFLVLTTVGCATVINTETKVVEATIVEVDKDPMIWTGKTAIPADYDILVRYENIESWIDVSRSEYDKYEKLVGTAIEVKLVVDYYDDNTIKQYFVLIEE